MAPPSFGSTTNKRSVEEVTTISSEEASINIKLSSAVVQLHEQLASQVDLCNNLLAQYASVRRIASTTPYGGGARLVTTGLTLRRLHPNWPNRLKSRLHSSLSECVETLRQFSCQRLPDLARQFDRAQSSIKDDVTLLVADFEFSLAVDTARPCSDIFERYTFERDDRALVAAHLRRCAARIDAELDRLINLVGFEMGDGAADDGANTALVKRAKFRHSSTSNSGTANMMAISLEPCLMLTTTNNNNDSSSSSETMLLNPATAAGANSGGAGGRTTTITVLPDWSVELALGRLSTGGGRFF